MKNLLTITSLVIIVIFNLTIHLSAQGPEQPKRTDHFFNQPNVSMNTYAHRPLSKDKVKELDAIIPDFQVNDDKGITGQRSPSVSTDGSGNFVIAWMDWRNGDYDIYAQRYSIDGSALGTNFKVNDDQGSADQRVPAIFSHSSGNFMITWEDKRNGDYDIYAQRYSIDGSTLGTNFKVNDDNGNEHQWNPSVSADASGNFVIAWGEDFRNGQGQADIYAQRYSSDGYTLGTNFKVNDDLGSAYQSFPSICQDGIGNLVISWVDEREGGSDIYAQRYSSDGGALGTNFKVNDDKGSAGQGIPSISSNSSGDFVITWYDERNRFYGDIYAQRYASDGSALGTNFKINDDEGAAIQRAPSISLDSSNNFIITWRDGRNGGYPDIYAQGYLSDGSALGNNFRVTNTSVSDQYQPDVELWNGQIYNVWQDNRTGDTWYDIWANVLDWTNPVGIRERELSQLPSAFILSQNYPNPFNPTTTIEFTLPHTEFVTLKIYNILGEEVATLVSEKLPAGEYKYKWDAGNLASGVYLYRLQAGDFVDVKKMVLMK